MTRTIAAALFAFASLGNAAGDTIEFTKSSHHKPVEKLVVASAYDASKRVPTWRFVGLQEEIDARDVAAIEGGPWRNVSVALKNGRVADGNIVTEIKGHSIKLRTREGKDQSVPLSGIARMTFHNSQQDFGALQQSADEEAHGPALRIRRMRVGDVGRLTELYSADKVKDDLIFAKFEPANATDEIIGGPYLFFRTSDAATITTGQILEFTGKWKVAGTHSLTNDETYLLLEPASDDARIIGGFTVRR